MRIVVTIWNFIIKQAEQFWFKITQENWWFKINQVEQFNFNITQQDNFSFKITIEPGSNWILKHGYWDDDGEWVDTEIWRDS